MDRTFRVLSPTLSAWVVAAALVGGSLGACGTLREDGITGDFTSVPAQPSDPTDVPTTTPVASPNDGGVVLSPNADTTTPTPSTNGDANAPAQTPNRRVSEGFALRAMDFAGYCLASRDVAPKVGSAVGLAPCSFTVAQTFSFYKGGFALSRSLCLQSSGVGGGITLQACTTGATQVWELNGLTHQLSHTIGSSPVKGQTAALASASASAQVVGQNAGGGSPLRLAIGAPVSVDGFPVRARDGQGTDVCLANVASSASMLPCNLRDSRQVWTFVGNQLQHVTTQRCLFGDTASRSVSLGACPSAPADNQQWYPMDFFISLMAPATTNASNSLVLVIDPTSRALSLSTSSGPDPTFSIGAAGPFGS